MDILFPFQYNLAPSILICTTNYTHTHTHTHTPFIACKIDLKLKGKDVHSKILPKTVTQDADNETSNEVNHLKEFWLCYFTDQRYSQIT